MQKSEILTTETPGLKSIFSQRFRVPVVQKAEFAATMKEKTMNAYIWTLRIIGFVMGAFILMITLPGLLNRTGEFFPGGFKLRGLALEWVKKPDEAIKIIDTHAARLLKDLKLDSQIVVPLYVFYYIALAWYLKIQGSTREIFLASAITISILIAGLYDLRENAFTSKVINNFNNSGRLDITNLEQKYWACYIKWSLIALVILLIGVMLITQGNSLTGMINLLAAIIFLAGFIGSKSITEWGFAAMGIGLLFIAFSL